MSRDKVFSAALINLQNALLLRGDPPEYNPRRKYQYPMYSLEDRPEAEIEYMEPNNEYWDNNADLIDFLLAEFEKEHLSFEKERENA